MNDEKDNADRPHPAHRAIAFLLNHAAIQQPESRAEALSLLQELDASASGPPQLAPRKAKDKYPADDAKTGGAKEPTKI